MKIKIKPRFFIFLLIIGYAVFAGIYLWNSGDSSTISLETPEGERVETVNSTGNDSDDALARLKEIYKDKLTVIFFYDGYENQKQALSYIELLKETLAIVEPFKSSNDTLLYKTFTTDSQKCSVKNNLLVCDEKLVESFKNLGVDHFKVVILSPLDFNSSVQPARGINSWMTVSTFKGEVPDEEFNRFIGAEFAQHLGMSLGLLPELSSSSAATLETNFSGRPNCASSLEEAQAWWGSYTLQFDAVSYNPGCGGSSSHLHPELGTIMSDSPEKESYGYVSEDYLRGALQCFYGNKSSITYPAGRAIVELDYARNCGAFRELYPEFWNE